jgi:hypothetical protein
VTHRETIWLGYVVNVVGCNQASSPGHILYGHAGIAGNVLAHMTRQRPCVGVETSSGRKTDDNADRLTFVKWLLSEDRINRYQVEGIKNCKG